MFDTAHYMRHKKKFLQGMKHFSNNFNIAQESFGASKMAIKMEIMQRRLNVNFCISCEIYFFLFRGGGWHAKNENFASISMSAWQAAAGRNIIHTLNLHFAIKHILFEY
jgi:hypothetical protein